MGYEYKQPVTNVAENVPTPSPDDIQAALDLIEENATLRNHPRVQALIKTNFVTESGRQLDPGNFLSRVLSLVEQDAQGESYEVKVERALQAMAVDSSPTR